MAIILAGLVILLVYEYFRSNKIANNGVYTLCTVTAVEAAKGGTMLRIRYAFGGKDYNKMVKESIGTRDIGGKFFLQILPHNPDELVFMRDIDVPGCILSAPVPDSGWKKLPSCPQ